ncbi:hypothetical protein DJ013_17265 [Arcticibacterium luteifluviistationis]|uniref:Mannosyltransferase n=2 Tax=Arcticibacterium luteifluviistationis TaxID=1784714 RepID=A0A2Z4GEW6_9BACT|nr:hypothetical protein DJ013_17265 [Arcticibacterium luteifluviistationis]
MHQGREDFLFYFVTLSALFALYLYSATKAKLEIWHILISAIVFRFVFIGFVPILSDDIYRFIWDGALGVTGFNPYLYLPSDFELNTIDGLFEKLNSPNYFSLYPPLNQYFFQIGALVGGGSLQGSIVAFRFILIGAFLGNFFLIKGICVQLDYSLSKTAKVLAIYVLNPFVIIETIGSLHFEGLMLMFLFASYWVYLKFKSMPVAAVLFAFSVSIKLVPLIFLPLIWRRLKFKKGLGFVSIALFCNLLLFLPFFQMDLLSNIWNSLDLYFHSFEFNASLYYLVRTLGLWFTGYNLIYYLGPILALISFSLILKVSFSKGDLLKASLFILFIYVTCTTTVHPWYIITLLGISLFTNFRFPVLWTYTICLSYFAYTFNPVKESPMLLILEYGLVFLAFYWEFKKKKALF